jgi:hypothetical protein
MGRAIDLHCEEVLNTLELNSWPAAEAIWMGLVTVDSTGGVFRRPATLAELVNLAAAPLERVQAIIEPFVQAGFLATSIEFMQDDNAVVDISSEALLRNWVRLQGWIRDEERSVQTYLQIVSRARLYEDQREEPLTGAALANARDWLERTGPTAAWSERYAPDFEQTMFYLQMSMEAQDREMKERAARSQREDLAEARMLGNRTSRSSVLGFFLGLATALATTWAYLSRG